jgi:hypothetical protein
LSIQAAICHAQTASAGMLQRSPSPKSCARRGAGSSRSGRSRGFSRPPGRSQDRGRPPIHWRTPATCGLMKASAQLLYSDHLVGDVQSAVAARLWAQFCRRACGSCCSGPVMPIAGSGAPFYRRQRSDGLWPLSRFGRPQRSPAELPGHSSGILQLH